VVELAVPIDRVDVTVFSHETYRRSTGHAGDHPLEVITVIA
jgi:hypothetical protein